MTRRIHCAWFGRLCSDSLSICECTSDASFDNITHNSRLNGCLG
jgi:hypothetical protein